MTKTKKDTKDGKKENDSESHTIDEKDKRIGDLVDTLQRLQADFENYKKRVEKQNSDFVKFAKADLLIKVLSIVDSLEIAFKNVKEKNEFIQGVELIYANLINLLESEGVFPIDAVGKPFDSNLHEALLYAQSDKDDIVLEEFQKGYLMHGKLLRPTKVKVSKKREGSGEQCASENSHDTQADNSGGKKE